MLAHYSDRLLSDGVLIFEIDVNELSQTDLARFPRPPRRSVIRHKLYNHNHPIPLMPWDGVDHVPTSAHSLLIDQSYVLVPSGFGGFVLMYCASVPDNESIKSWHVHDLIDEIRPRLLFNVAEDRRRSILHILQWIHDVQYIFKISS